MIARTEPLSFRSNHVVETPDPGLRRDCHEHCGQTPPDLRWHPARARVEQVHLCSVGGALVSMDMGGCKAARRLWYLQLQV